MPHSLADDVHAIIEGGRLIPDKILPPLKRLRIVGGDPAGAKRSLIERYVPFRITPGLGVGVGCWGWLSSLSDSRLLNNCLFEA